MDNDFIKFVKSNSDEVISLANKLDELRKDFRSTVNQVLQLAGDKIKDKMLKLLCRWGSGQLFLMRP